MVLQTYQTKDHVVWESVLRVLVGQQYFNQDYMIANNEEDKSKDPDQNGSQCPVSNKALLRVTNVDEPAMDLCHVHLVTHLRLDARILKQKTV